MKITTDAHVTVTPRRKNKEASLVSTQMTFSQTLMPHYSTVVYDKNRASTTGELTIDLSSSDYFHGKPNNR